VYSLGLASAGSASTGSTKDGRVEVRPRRGEEKAVQVSDVLALNRQVERGV
jgi:hypothetical protein